MSLEVEDREKLTRLTQVDPGVTIFLRPIAPPAALGLAGFAGSTWITASWVAGWWGDDKSPSIFFPFVAFWGGLAQFIAGFMGFPARDTLVTVVNVLWGSFWMSAGSMWFLVTAGYLPVHTVHEHFPELASWLIVMTFFTWSAAVASISRDMILCGVLTCLAIGSTIACCLFSFGGGVNVGMYVAAYFWIISAILAWWRVTIYLVEEGFGRSFRYMRYLPVFKTPMEKRKPLVIPGFGEPGVQRAMPGVV